MKQRKLGVWTTGVSFVILGLIVLFTMSGTVQWTVVKYLWPLILIGFGLEIILTRVYRPDSTLRFSGFGLFFLIVVCVISFASVSFGKFALSPSYLVGVSGHIPSGTAIQRVDVEIYDGDVTVRGVTSNTVDYTGDLHIFGTSQEDANHQLNRQWKVETDGDTVRLIQQKPENKISFSLFDAVSTHAHLDLQVPPQLLSNIQTNNGSVHISHMKADSTANSSNGSITFDTIKGSVFGTTSNGRCTATGIQGIAKLHSSNGAIDARNIGGLLTAGTSNGSVDVTSAIHGNWTLSTSNGHIAVKLPQTASCQLTGDTSNGEVRGNLDWRYGGDDKSHATGKLGSGSYNVDMKTSNGGIDVNQGQ